jgi:hypothetical protein
MPNRPRLEARALEASPFGERASAVTEEPVFLDQGIDSSNQDVAHAGCAQARRTIPWQIELPAVFALAGREKRRISRRGR